jgi:hypothetical protein
MATTETYTPGQLYSVPLAELQADPNQPRKYLDPQALEELTASVAQHGILEPILFRQDKQTGLLYFAAAKSQDVRGTRHSGLYAQDKQGTVFSVGGKIRKKPGYTTPTKKF